MATKKMDVQMATLPLVYLNELLSAVGKTTMYDVAVPLMTKVHKSVKVETQNVDVEVEETPVSDEPVGVDPSSDEEVNCQDTQQV